MKSDKNILIAFLLNAVFCVLEFFGGLYTGSVAIISDSVHDLGDALGIGLAYFFEKKSKKQPDKTYTFGYARFSLMGGFITTAILLAGSVVVVYNAVVKILNPTDIKHNGMIIFAIVGVIVNFLAAYFTKEGDSVNQRAVNLHMLEDVLGWAVVLVGAVIIKFTGFVIIDPIMSICVAVFIFVNALGNLKSVVDIFLLKSPKNVDDVANELLKIEGVEDVHHIHLWDIDEGVTHATMHVVTNADSSEIKHKIKHKLEHIGISHTTVELEKSGERCHSVCCKVGHSHSHHHHHHHHHH